MKKEKGCKKENCKGGALNRKTKKQKEGGKFGESNSDVSIGDAKQAIIFTFG